MQKFVMMCGLPGSGKTAYAHKLAAEINAIVISSDAIRQELYNGVVNNSTNKDVFNVMLHRTRSVLQGGGNVIYDATNVKRKNRLHLLESLRTCHVPLEKVIVLMLVSKEQCCERDAQREGMAKVGQDVVEHYWKSFNPPAYWEGWDKIKIEYEEDPELIAFYTNNFPFWDFEQDNSHHKLTLGNHLNQTLEYLVEHLDTPDVGLLYAGYFHDIGKVKTKAFINIYGNKSEQAHYYGHHHVGAYEFMCWAYTRFKEGPLLDIASLIDMHMDPIILWKNSPKSKQIIEKLAGEFYINRVELLSEADRNSRG